MIDEESIVMLTPDIMFSRDFMLELMDEEPEERSRLSALIILRAKELGVEKEFKSVMKSYNEADRKLAAEYNRSWQREHAKIPLDFDGNGKPLSSIDNYVRVFEGDKKFEGIRFNLLTHAPEQLRNGEVHKWVDADDAETRRYIEKKYKGGLPMSIERKDLALEIKTAIEDLFEADLSSTDDFLLLKFFNGQNFYLKIEEK